MDSETVRQELADHHDLVRDNNRLREQLTRESNTVTSLRKQLNDAGAEIARRIAERDNARMDAQRMAEIAEEANESARVRLDEIKQAQAESDDWHRLARQNRDQIEVLQAGIDEVHRLCWAAGNSVSDIERTPAVDAFIADLVKTVEPLLSNQSPDCMPPPKVVSKPIARHKLPKSDVNLTAEQWQLYTVDPEFRKASEKAAVRLNKCFDAAVNLGWSKDQVREAAHNVMNEERKCGAYDTEPRGVLEDLLDAAFGKEGA
jgi:hypothetical protein